MLYALRAFARKFPGRWASVDAVRAEARVRSLAVVRQALENLSFYSGVSYDRANGCARYTPSYAD